MTRGMKMIAENAKSSLPKPDRGKHASCMSMRFFSFTARNDYCYDLQ